MRKDTPTYRAFESLLHRQIDKTQTPDFPGENRGFVVFGVSKKPLWDHHGTGALFWCVKGVLANPRFRLKKRDYLAFDANRSCDLQSKGRGMDGIGRRLREERVRLGYTQAAFAALGGVLVNAQGKYERGLRSPSALYLARLAEIDVDVIYILTGRCKR